MVNMELIFGRKANGEGTEYLTVENMNKKAFHTKQHLEDVTSNEFLKEKLFELTGKVCQKLRDMNWMASTIQYKTALFGFSNI